jgi:hypothetical protein
MASFKQIAVNRLNAPRNSDPVRPKLRKLGWSAQAVTPANGCGEH